MSQSSIVIGIIINRLKQDGSLALRDIAKEAHCSPAYVSKIFKDLRLGDHDGIRGWKNKDGSIEAIG